MPRAAEHAVNGGRGADPLKGPWRAIYERLLARGKAQVALVAVTRKLIVLANELLQSNRLCQDAPPPRRSTQLATQGST